MAICSFQVECSEKNQKDEWENLILRGSCFEKSAEFVNQWFNDGDLCVATGKLFTEVYEKDGVKKYTTKLKFPKIEFPPRAKKSDENSSSGHNEDSSGYSEPASDNSSGYSNKPYQAPAPIHEDHPDKQNQEPLHDKQGSLPMDDDLEIPF